MAQVSQKTDKGNKPFDLGLLRVSNKYDPYLLKNSIEEYIVHFLENKSVVQDQRHSNVKILTGLVVTIIVLCSHFYPVPFPQNYYILIACVASYSLLSGFLTYYDKFVEKGVFYAFKYDKASEYNNLNGKSISIASGIELFSDQFTLSVWDSDKPNQVFKKTTCFENYFTKQGDIVPQNVESLLKSLLQELNKAK